ncbi:MAG: class I SAM-dependent methyltransferase, partial [Anaerolineaceae bacterium]|nr:class I SAM-dependent methyltransferase [Anaerolineaceae bacterium]
MKRKNKVIFSKKNNITSAGWSDYELLDSGNQRKLEQFGNRRLIRFEPEAVWKPSLPISEWTSADAEYVILKGKNSGDWNFLTEKDPSWSINLDNLSVELNIAKSRHIGIFPEQLENWRWIKEKINKSNRAISVLNIFAYTGISTLYAAKAGAAVTHVDASRKAIEIGKISCKLSGMSNKPIRWIVDDALKFIQRENRRGKKYDAVIMDPPKFGRGPKGEVWKFEKDISELLLSCSQVL